MKFRKVLVRNSGVIEGKSFSNPITWSSFESSLFITIENSCKRVSKRLILCLTPNLCCSSIITKPNLLKTTESSINAWVPINILTVPLTRFLSISFRFFCLVDPVKALLLAICFVVSVQRLHNLKKSNVQVNGNLGNNISNVTLQRPGESFAVAERRVRERLKKKKNEGNVNKKEMYRKKKVTQ